MKPVKTQQFAYQLQEFLNRVDQINEKVNPSYIKLKAALDDHKLAEMPDADFKEIAADFYDASEAYEKEALVLENLQVPVQLLGMKTNLVGYFHDYVLSTQEMAESLDPDKQQVAMAEFSKSEEDHEHFMANINHTMTRILTAPGLRR
ncbi:MAG: hypothetical protein ABF703_04085 [Oenococcus sp.]|uniref:hypothetical protein n=1 Tax=Oenococcus sp. TaxID=1979414 RepID=UPI0039E74E6C